MKLQSREGGEWFWRHFWETTGVPVNFQSHASSCTLWWDIFNSSLRLIRNQNSPAARFGWIQQKKVGSTNSRSNMKSRLRHMDEKRKTKFFLLLFYSRLGTTDLLALGFISNKAKSQWKQLTTSWCTTIDFSTMLAWHVDSFLRQ